MAKINKITVNNKPITIVQGVDHSNYICLTDMVRAQEKDVERVNMVIQNWMRRKDTIEYLGLWEHLNNPTFNDTEFDVIKTSSGSNRFILTVKEWNERTGAVGIIAKVGRYGGTYAHRDIAFNFGMWLSPELYLLVVKELQRLESSQNNPLLLQWDIKRILSKTNYVIHTDAIKNCIMPTLNIEKTQERIVYATEADMLNLVLFGCTARDWQEANPELAKKMNIRDTASINELLVLSNLESYNGEMIRNGKNRQERYERLVEMRNEQLRILQNANADFNFRKLAGRSAGFLPDSSDEITSDDENV